MRSSSHFVTDCSPSIKCISQAADTHTDPTCQHIPLYFSFMLRMLLLLDTNDDLGESMLPRLSLEDVESDRSSVKLFNEALDGDSRPEFNLCKSPPLPFDFFESVD